MGRRGILTGLGRAVPALAVATSASGIALGSNQFVVKREDIHLPQLPPALDGFKIGQLTDVHVGTFIDVAYVRGAVQALNDAKVDLQVMTGDLIDDLEQLDGTFEALSQCSARHGMLAILGNHEHWRGVKPIARKYREAAAGGAALKLLVDENVVIDHDGSPLRVVGVDFPMTFGAQREALMKRSAEVAFRGVQPGETVLCLSHHPDFFDYAADAGAHLTLSGHTHGGQVAAFGASAFWFAFKHMLGRYRRGDQHLYVSGGTGHWLPFRIGVPTEVTVLTLRRT